MAGVNDQLDTVEHHEQQENQVQSKTAPQQQESKIKTEVSNEHKIQPEIHEKVDVEPQDEEKVKPQEEEEVEPQGEEEVEPQGEEEDEPQGEEEDEPQGENLGSDEFDSLSNRNIFLEDAQSLSWNQNQNREYQALSEQLHESIIADSSKLKNINTDKNYDSNYDVDVSVAPFTPQAISPFTFPVETISSSYNNPKEGQVHPSLQQEILQQSDQGSQLKRESNTSADDSHRTGKDKDQCSLVELYRRELISKMDKDRICKFEDSKKDFLYTAQVNSKAKEELLEKLQFKGPEKPKDLDTLRSAGVSSLQMNFLKHQFMSESHLKNAEEETMINQELSIIFLQKLESGLRNLEILSEIVKRLQVGEDFYSKVLDQCGVRIPPFEGSQGDHKHSKGDSTSDAISSLKILLQNLSMGHQSIFKGLKNQQVEMEVLILLYKEALKNISQFSNLAHKNLQTSKYRLMQTLRDYENCIGAADNAMNSTKGLYTIAGVEKDPWEAECSVVQSHYHLHRVQNNERQYLKSAFMKVESLENQRIGQTQATINQWLKDYFACMETLRNRANEFQDRIDSIDQDKDLSVFKRTGQSSEETAMKLEARDQQTLWNLFVGLLGSQEIVKQGQLSVIQEDSSHHSQEQQIQYGQWKQLHFVLTRSGFLYGKNTMEDILPQHGYTIPLSKGNLGQSDAPEFQINIQRGGNIFRRQYQKLTFKSDSIEECTEWIMCIKDAIQAFKKQ